MLGEDLHLTREKRGRDCQPPTFDVYPVPPEDGGGGAGGQWPA
jgi:hypothetical protein